MKKSLKRKHSYLVVAKDDGKPLAQVKASSLENAFDKAIAAFPKKPLWVQEGIIHPPPLISLVGE